MANIILEISAKSFLSWRKNNRRAFGKDKMKENMGKTDKVMRILAVVAIVALNITVNIHPILALLLGIAAVVLVFTAVAGVCPLYRILGISTRTERDK